METVTATISAVSAGNTFAEQITETGNSIERVSVSVPAAKVGTLSARTDADTGTLTMSSGHGFSTGNKIDVFWTGGSRRNMTATVTGDSVAVDGGNGDALPVATTAITAMVPTSVVFDVSDGDTVVFLSASSPVSGWVVFFDDAGTPAAVAGATWQLPGTNGSGKSWINGNGVTNPVASTTLTAVKFSHGDSSQARTMIAQAIFNG